MTEPKVNDDKQIPNQVSEDEVKALVANLDEEGKQAVAAEATKTASGEAKPEVVTQVVRSAGTFEARKAAAAEAVNSASPENKVKVAGEAVEQLSLQEQKEIAHSFLPSPAIADEIWLIVVNAFKWVLWGAALGLIGISGLAAFRNVDLANI